MVRYVLIPCDDSLPLQTLAFELSDDADGASSSSAGGRAGAGDRLPSRLFSLLSSSENGKGEDVEIEIHPLRRMGGDDDDEDGDNDAVYAYSLTFFYDPHEEESRAAVDGDTLRCAAAGPNIRATSLAMACGLHYRRFRGDVYIGRLGYGGDDPSIGLRRAMQNKDLTKEEVRAACVSPDLRVDIIKELTKAAGPFGEDQCAGEGREEEDIVIPGWLANSGRRNYQDSASLSALASVMISSGDAVEEVQEISSDDEDSSSDEDSSDDESDRVADLQEKGAENPEQTWNPLGDGDRKCGAGSKEQTLCLHCRGPSVVLCPNCEGAYFCAKPRRCVASGWSHRCVCFTWRIYNERRAELSSFSFHEWHLPLLGRQCQVSEEPYRRYLRDELHVLGGSDDSATSTSWWTTELDGWAAGRSRSARTVNALARRSYKEGFALGDAVLVPPERRVTDEEVTAHGIKRDECGLLLINSWEEYYRLRGIPLSSPVALLCTFPLTIYHAIRRYGAVPVTVARMLHRKLRIHCVGTEKEMNFLDLFKEVGFLLPEDLEVELTFVVREDMVPPASRGRGTERGCEVRLDLTDNLTLMVKSGTYGSDIDPNFDCGSGTPDMIIGLNAGLFAYESWRSVISYLDANRGVVGVFTDYNEHSGTNCASLGGGKARETLVVNPFRQPRAMPVFCMNLPQLSNCFIYVYNEQELDV